MSKGFSISNGLKCRKYQLVKKTKNNFIIQLIFEFTNIDDFKFNRKLKWL